MRENSLKWASCHALSARLLIVSFTENTSASLSHVVDENVETALAYLT